MHACPCCLLLTAAAAGLLDDAYSLSHVRQLNISIFLNLIQALGSRARPELPPWDTALGWLQRMTDVLSTAGRFRGLFLSWPGCIAVPLAIARCMCCLLAVGCVLC
jgi:hypothetical protein